MGVAALAGMGGVGKTVVALSVCHTQTYAAPLRIVWRTFGNEPRAKFHEWLAAQVGHIARALDQKYETRCLAEYRGMLRGRAVLIVLDDVWDKRDVVHSASQWKGNQGSSTHHVTVSWPVL